MGGLFCSVLMGNRTPLCVGRWNLPIMLTVVLVLRTTKFMTGIFVMVRPDVVWPYFIYCGS